MTSPGDSSSGSATETDIHLAEWQTARTLLSAVDTNLHDLRKYGFTFLTALLAAESILLPYVPSSGGSSGLPDIIKLGVFSVTLLLIFTLHLMDQNYIVLQEAAATRAKVLEREINTELTEIISDRYARNNVENRVLSIYVLFAIGVTVLGSFVFFQDVWYIVPLVVAFGLTAFGIYNSKTKVNLKYRWETNIGDKKAARDWTVGPLDCVEGDMVRITLTNLTTSGIPVPSTLGSGYEKMTIPVPIVLPANQPIWQIEDELGNIKEMKVPSEDIAVYENYTWLWDTKGVETGVYQVRTLDRPLPLSRKIIVVSKPTQQPTKPTDKSTSEPAK